MRVIMYECMSVIMIINKDNDNLIIVAMVSTGSGTGTGQYW